ncbi:hypothetical protein P0082_09770 [Candidatus Haliotispira prima]|uniref:Uncharacterized protein n=1 Tax=Candidatus Haliotispira prima TaxID=3034016 RepID=A0ABY8MFK3_9SPIO|nr:hypothetical protein P0082_09770 [Candidatus Haliotispira prima]
MTHQKTLLTGDRANSIISNIQYPISNITLLLKTSIYLYHL